MLTLLDKHTLTNGSKWIKSGSLYRAKRTSLPVQSDERETCAESIRLAAASMLHCPCPALQCLAKSIIVDTTNGYFTTKIIENIPWQFLSSLFCSMWSFVSSVIDRRSRNSGMNRSIAGAVIRQSRQLPRAQNGEGAPPGGIFFLTNTYSCIRFKTK